MKKIFSSLLFLVSFLFAENAQTIKRDNWQYNTTSTLETAEPTNLKYFKYFETIPDEISLKIFDNQDLSHLAGKKLVVGIGVADKGGEDCKIFKKEDTGQAQDITVCLPWWRIEREYKENVTKVTGASFLDKLKIPKAPLSVNYCKEYSDGKVYPGGIVTCTTYFDRNAGGDCWNNPEQQKCFVDNCGGEVKNKCTYLDSAVGDVTTLPSSVINDIGLPQQEDTKIKLTTHRYECPSGPLTEDINCVNEENVIMYPYECKEDDPNTDKDDGEYIYCDENKPNFDTDGSILSFNGICSDGTNVVCEVNKFKNTTKICTQPIYETEIITKLKNVELSREANEVLIDVLSGEPDIYSVNANCLRSNTVEDARNQELFVKIVGSGSLDDDIYVLKHKADGQHSKIYCNMQHNESNNSRKSYNGEVLQCIDNDGSYTFDQTVSIDTSDIVSVQQNSENENVTGVPFAIGRNHYSSTKVTIDGIEVAPNTFTSTFPYYPGDGPHLRTWDNTNSTLSILFPFAGAYELFFYNKDNEEIAKAYLDIEDFKEIALNGSLQLKLGKIMKLAPGMDDDILNPNGTVATKKANREDMWVEWGGGVFGGRDSLTGESVSNPNDAYVKENAVTNIIAKDLLTGSIVPIPLTYPMAYPNRIFISKLKVYEYRKYRCYDDFPQFSIMGQTSETRYVCSTSDAWNNYINGFTDNIDDAQQWNENTLCEQNCRSNYTCIPKTETGVNGYTCSQRGGEDLGGDLGGNFFSNQESCDASCFIQNSCEPYINSNCKIVDEQQSEPVSDWTGKTLFRNKEISYSCDTRFDKQVDCAEYDVKVTEGTTTYNFDAVGFETKDYSNSFEDALTKAQMLEVGQQHIFSGWAGKCVQGKKWDFSYLSDPMTIMSYAMSAYSSINQMSEWGVGWAKNMQSEFDTFTKSISDSVDSAMNELSGTIEEGVKSVQDGVSATQETLTNGIQEGAQKTTEQTISNMSPNINPDISAQQNLTNGVTETSKKISSIQKIKNLTQETMNKYLGTNIDFDGSVLRFGNYVNITQGDLMLFGLKSAMIIAAPSEQDYLTADKMLKGYSGIGTNEPEAHNYNACMASIGASFPNLIGWSVSSVEDSSEELIAPWKHPLRMTTLQIAAIASVKGENFVTSQYMVDDTDNVLLNVIAISPQAYLQATQTICMGVKVSQAAQQIQDSNNSANGGGANVGLAIAKAALSMVCAPCGFAMTVVMDLANNVFASIDTCNDEKDAMQWSMKDFKTNKFQSKEQCHYVKSECDKKVSFGFGKKCVRTRNEYCCYDQIITKIFAEGIKAQTYPENSPDMWNSCNDITVDSLKDIVVRECKPGEIAYINKCIPSSSYNEFQQTLFRQASKNINTSIGAGLVDQALNSMAIQKAKE